MPDLRDANTIMTTLRGQLDLLQTMINTCNPRCTVYEIPLYENGEVPDAPIEPKKATGSKGLTIALSALRNLSRPKNQHPGSVRRVPGIIQVDNDLADVVRIVNDTKDELSKFIQDTYDKPSTRNQFYRRQFPGRSMLQVYRHIHTLKSSVVRVQFTWHGHSESKKKIQREEALARLYRRYDSGIDLDNPNRLEALRIALRQIESSDKNTQYVIIKKRSPFPAVNLLEADGERPDQLPANIPIITNAQDIEIIDLQTYVKKPKANQRSDKKVNAPIFLPMFLYSTDSAIGQPLTA